MINRNILVNDPKPRMVLFTDVITEAEAKALRKVVKARPKEVSLHAAIVTWINSQPQVLERWNKLELLDSYGAYLLEYHLQLK
jgi:hypothetical protein